MSSLTICKICHEVCKDKVHRTPYWSCPNCNAWFQDPAPPKRYIGAHEPEPTAMDASEIAANHSVAEWLHGHLKLKDGARTLDIGAKWPILASALEARGAEAHAMDGDKRVRKWARELGVIGHVADFERANRPKECMFDLITMVHTFEHFYDPVAAIRKLRDWINPSGRVFIRMPASDVRGIERDLFPSMFEIHPFVHCHRSLLQALVAAEDCFVIESDTALEPGQRDIILRPINSKRRIMVGMIVKNEERDLPRVLASIRNAADEVLIVDTGSTDRTAQIAADSGATIGAPFLDASRQDENGDWKLYDFGAARNQAITSAKAIAAMGKDHHWYAWFDADDVLITPHAIRRASYDDTQDVYGCWIQDGGRKWIQHRMWRASAGVRFEGKCHEYPILDGLRVANLDDCLIQHHSEPGVGETSNARNLRILLEEWDEKQSARTAFYLANTYRDGGQHEKAAAWYEARINFGEAFREEWLFAWLYGIRSKRAAGQECTEMIEQAIQHAPGWAEFRMEKAHDLYARNLYAEAIEAAMLCIDMPMTPSILWRETEAYGDAPCRHISWCNEALGNIALAITWAEEAQRRIGGPDAEWDARLARLRGDHERQCKPAGVVIKADEKPRICLNRPGAIGDILMTLNLLPALREANPDHEIWYFCHESLAAEDKLGWIIRAAGADRVMHSSGFDAWAKGAAKAVNLVGYPLAEGYPDKPMSMHLLQYFADDMQLHTYFMPGALPSLTVPRPPRPSSAPEGDYVTIQMEAGWSKYKQWPRDKWNAVMRALPDIQFFGISKDSGMTLRQSIAVFANATMHVGIDSFCNHLTNYFWSDDLPKIPGAAVFSRNHRTPGVILWGSTQASAAGYPHNTNITRALPCQPCFRENPAISRMDRGPCVAVIDGDSYRVVKAPSYLDVREHACMADITIEEVVEAVRAKWEELT